MSEAAGTAPMVLARGLRKTYRDPERGTFEAVRGVDLECRPGEVFGLLGPNGAGKTTTLRMLATILAPTAGTAHIDGIDVTADPLEARRRLGYLSTSTGLYPRLTGRETLRWFGELHGLERAEADRRIEDLARRFDMTEFVDARCEALSTGQKQKVSTTGLDVLAAGSTIDFVEERKRAGTCILLSTHVLAEAERLCDRIGVIDHGRVIGCGTLEELRAETGQAWLEDVFRELVRRCGRDVARRAGAESSK